MKKNEKPVILLVDDDRRFIAMVKAIFTTMCREYRIEVARSFDRAMSVIRRTEGPLVVFVSFPNLGKDGKDGFDLLEYIHKTVRYRTLSYAWTREDNREDRVRALRLGATHVYTKTDRYDLDWASLIDHIDNDVTTRLISEAAESTLDERTGLMRITTFDAVVEAEFKNPKAKVYTLVALDMDKFNVVNALHGHETGSKALGVVGKIIRENVRPDDHSCRSGVGDEFFILLCGADESVAERICKKLQLAIRSAKVFDPKKRRVALSISYGAATLPAGKIGYGVKRTLANLKELSDEELRKVKANR